MKDFKVVSAKTILNVTGVSPVRGFNPPSILVRGDRLELATEVYFNEVTVDEFIISGPNRLIVKIPPSQVGRSLNSLRILSQAMLTKTDSLLTLELPKPLGFVQGLERLVQTFVLVFLTTPGSDIWEPNSGGGATAIIGKNTNYRGKGVAADLVLALDRTKTEIRQFQSKMNIPLSEKLLSVDLQSLNFVAEESALNARVALTNMLGDQAEVAVG